MWSTSGHHQVSGSVRMVILLGPRSGTTTMSRSRRMSSLQIRSSLVRVCVPESPSSPPPPRPMARRSDVSTLVGLRLCGLWRCNPSSHCRVPSPQPSLDLNLPSTSSLGAASGFADPKPSPWPCFVTFVEVNVALGAERRRFEKKKVETPRRVPREMSELAFQAPQKHDRPDSQIARGRGEGKQMAPQLPHSLAGRRPTVGARKNGQQVCPLVDGADCLEADPRRFKSGACRTMSTGQPRLGGAAATPAESHEDRYWFNEAPSLDISRLLSLVPTPLDG